MVQPTLQKMSLKEAHESFSSTSRGPILEDQRLQIEELDEWRTHKPRTPDKLKLCQNELDTSPNQLKVGDKVLLDAADPYIVPTTLKEEIPLTVLIIFPFGTVEVSHPNFGSFKRYGQAHGRASGCVKTGQKISLTWATIKCHGRAIGRGSQCYLQEERKLPYLLQRRGRERPLPRARPLITGHCIEWAIVEQVQMADVIRVLLTTDPWELFFGIIEPTYLKLTMELCSTFHLQTVMINYDDPGTVQFHLGRLIRQLSVPEFGAALGLIRRISRRRMNYMLSVATYMSLPRSAGTLWPLARPPTILAAPRHQFSHHS
ncbi:hypothetical protein GOBAR_AA03651 [Gossypium barbadense]|uniref:Uncharacterized protein n=1 Tax=Gossypium barbadense TaxID=3634 RepID=A0A2P5YN06_GOSBA|nr:hypothetical protein GOBAR_AA03651 [Gossypium barbadense]